MTGKKTTPNHEYSEEAAIFAARLLKINQFWQKWDISSSDEKTIDDLCTSLIQILPEVIAEPGDTNIRIKLGDQTYSNKGFKKSNYSLVAEIKQGTQRFGQIEFHYQNALISEKNTEVQSSDQNLLDNLAERLALACRFVEKNADIEELKQEALQAYDRTIEAWSAALDTQDKEASGHTKRVTDLALSLAEEMGFSGEDLNNIRRGALLHDIGKISIPDEIILKPGKLTDDEFEIVKKHPIFAQKWLSQIELLKPALQIPYYHHERWDGSGYPQGLAKEEIPVIARMFAVVDVWDALISDRPFRNAMTKDAALDLIVSEAGKQFDPEVVEVFLRVLSENNYLDTTHPLRIQAFGQARVWVQNRRVTSKQWQVANARDLFFLFLAHSDPLSKEQVGLKMWPDLSTEDLDVRFKNTLYRLRRAVGNEVILLDDDGYRFNKMIDYFYDVETFETSYEKAQSAEEPIEKLNFLIKAIRNYHGDYLPDVDTFWVMTDREHYRLTYVNALLQIADLYYEQGDLQSALNYADKVLSVDPVTEEAHRLAMEIYASFGNQAGVIRQYEACCQALDFNFGVGPSDQTQELYENLVNAKEA